MPPVAFLTIVLLMSIALTLRNWCRQRAHKRAHQGRLDALVATLGQDEQLLMGAALRNPNVGKHPGFWLNLACNRHTPAPLLEHYWEEIQSPEIRNAYYGRAAMRLAEHPHTSALVLKELWEVRRRLMPRFRGAVLAALMRHPNTPPDIRAAVARDWVP